MKKTLLFLTLLGIGWILQAQSFKPDRSMLVARILNRHDLNIRTGACERGLGIMEIYYLLTEYSLVWDFPLTGIFYNDEFDSYTVWSESIVPEQYFLCDSIAMHRLRTDGDGVWIDFELYDGWKDPPLEDDTAWHRGCSAVGIYVPNTDMSDALQKLKEAKVYTCNCGENPLQQVSKTKLKQIQIWPNVVEGLEILRDSFPLERRPLEMTNFNLSYHERLGSPETKSAYMLEVLYCATPSKLHHLFIEGGRHDGYILRYFFKAKRWTVTYVKDTVTGWQTFEGYIDPATGKIIGAPE